MIYPPVDTNWIEPNLSEERDETFLYVGALVPYKRVDVVIEAFNRCKLPLIVAGEGPLYPSLKKIAKKNIKFVGRVSDKELAALYRRCKALMFSGCEDFGMIPVEAMAAGTPVIAPFKGGCKETVKGIRYWQEIKGAQEEEKEASGVFFRYFSSPRRQVEEILRALFFFEKNKERIKAVNCIKQADVFSPERFKREWRIFIALTLSKEKGRGLNKGLVHYR
ncbi:MAG: glycosyltransferase [Candidatus Dadabacteria bacterium]|nr:MAG: glycosyltransferase [Candidatus Dadabacteria bacterium]